MLGGMRALPGGEWSGTPTAESELGESGLAQVDHGFTHFDLRLTLVRSETLPEGPGAATEGEWWPLSALDAAGLPTLYRKLDRKSTRLNSSHSCASRMPSCA